jgi:hypothetical protein
MINMNKKHRNEIAEEKFSNDPEENLRIENEILKLQMQAESNAVFNSLADIPPEIENQFLHHVKQFEDAWRNVKTIKVYDLLHRPSFVNEAELTDAELPTHLKRIKTIMEDNHICLHIEGRYDSRTIYKFITEELFDHETDDIQLPGMTKNFCYEEFHPNHRLEIEHRAMEFLQDWFEQKFNEHSWELHPTFILPDGRMFSKAKVLSKFRKLFDSYPIFRDCEYVVAETSYEWNDEESTGMGHAEGAVRYEAVTESGEAVTFEGPFKLYMTTEGSWWTIIYFVFPGFVW